eukprot:TRINITY_DN1256_c0_g1_i1.p1 TRINITY_DN1256_c0_g1~~TRINITY_DN1256_c0_g1_i1.p1  ORF type:complete len:251 (-),score=58.27 TRINITY_DN1256_c0_g1_i1:61-813(-)
MGSLIFLPAVALGVFDTYKQIKSGTDFESLLPFWIVVGLYQLFYPFIELLKWIPLMWIGELCFLAWLACTRQGIKTVYYHTLQPRIAALDEQGLRALVLLRHYSFHFVCNMIVRFFPSLLSVVCTVVSDADLQAVDNAVAQANSILKREKTRRLKEGVDGLFAPSAPPLIPADAVLPPSAPASLFASGDMGLSEPGSSLSAARPPTAPASNQIDLTQEQENDSVRNVRRRARVTDIGVASVDRAAKRYGS